MDQNQTQQLPRGGTLTAVITAAILLCAWFIGPPAGTAAALENRPPAQFPSISWSNLADASTYAQIEAWAKDNVRIKPLTIQSVNDVAAKTNLSVTSPLVVYGAPLHDGRPREMFSGIEFTDRCWQRPSYQVFSKVIRKLRNEADSTGKRLLFIITPSKHRVLGRLLGDRLQSLELCAQVEDRIIAKLAREFPDNLKVIKPGRVLYWEPINPYWVGDGHWTSSAGRALSEQILMFGAGITRHRADQHLNNRLYFSGTRAAGGLYQLAGSKQTTLEPVLRTQPLWAVSRTFPLLKFGDDRTFAWTAPYPLPTASKSLLIVHDSFVNMPSLNTQFSSFFASGYDVHWNEILSLAQVPPVETVVVENLDRTFLQRLVAAKQSQELKDAPKEIDLLSKYLATP